MKNVRKIAYLSLVTLLLVTVGCSNSHTQVESDQNDNETKSMVLDILHTKEGVDALHDIIRDPRLKESVTITPEDVQQATVTALTDPSSHVQLMDQMKNPNFGSTVTKSYREDNQAVLKTMMKDPQYQQMMLEILKSPDFQQTLFDLMKTNEYRQHAVEIMKEALENPDFKMQMLQLVKQNIQSGVVGTSKQQPQKQDQSSEQSGGTEGEKQDGKESKQGQEQGKEQGEGSESGG